MKKAEGVTVKIVRGGYEVSIPGHAPRVYKPARGPLTQRGALECAKFAYRQACAQAKATKLAGPPVSATKARKILHDKKIRGVPLTKAQRGMFGAASRGNPRLKKYGLVTLLKMTYKDVEQLRNWGHISDDEWKSYVRVWREASPRYSDLGTGHGEPTARERAHIKKFQADYDRRFPKTNPRQRPAGRKCGNCRHDVSMHRYMIGAPSSGPQKCGVKGCDCVVYAQKGPRYKNPNRTNPTACRGCGRCVARPRPRPGECRRVGP